MANRASQYRVPERTHQQIKALSESLGIEPRNVVTMAVNEMAKRRRVSIKGKGEATVTAATAQDREG